MSAFTWFFIVTWIPAGYIAGRAVLDDTHSIGVAIFVTLFGWAGLLAALICNFEYFIPSFFMGRHSRFRKTLYHFYGGK